MANLTGQYDVVTEIGIPLLNRVVAAMHASEDTRFPRFMHSFEMFLDDTHRGSADPIPAGERSGIRTRVAVQLSTPTVSLPTMGDPFVLSPVLAHAAGVALGPAPGAAWRFGSDVFPDRGDWDIYLPPTYPKVAGRVRIRAWVRDTTELPEFIDGDLTVTVGLTRVDVPGGGTFLTFERVESLSVRFVPATGTTVSDEQRSLIERLVRNVVRAEFEPLTFEVPLPAGVRHFNVRLQPTAPSPSVAAMFVLQDRPPPSSPAGVAQGFLPAGADFGVAIGRDYLGGLLRAQLLSGLQEQFSFSGAWGAVHGWVRPQWANVTFDLEWGRAVLAVPGTGQVTYGPSIGGATTDNFSFVARLGIGLALVDGIPQPVAAGDPELDFSGLAIEVGFVTDQARSRLKQTRDEALAAGRAQIRKSLDVGRMFGDILKGLVANPSVSLTSVAIQPDGVVVGGRVQPFSLPPPVVVHRERDGMLDALESWIPGGTIERFVWKRSLGAAHGSGRVEEHRFVTEAAHGPFESVVSSMCLTIEGSREGAGGAIPVSATGCTGLVLSMSMWRSKEQGSGRPLLPLTSVGADGRARVTGHYDPWAGGAAPSNGGTCLLVHFANADWPATQSALTEALGARKKEGALIVVVALPPGSDPIGETAVEDVPVVVALDDDGRWARAYEVEGAPATVLVGPQGTVVWRDDEPLKPATLAKALDKHAEEGSRVSRHPLRTAVRQGGRSPDFPIGLLGGAELSVRRLQGRDVLLVFWSSRSEPSVRHVHDLARLMSARNGSETVVVAVGDGETADAVQALARREPLPFPVLPDPQRVIASRFGISCWPTTILVGPDQRIHAIELGATAGRSRSENGKGRPSGS